MKLKLLPILLLLSILFFASPTLADYNCGAAASCASLGKSGNAGDKYCTGPCNTVPNSCYTTGACTDTFACTKKEDCPTNLSCPSGTCGGSVQCNMGGGNCYSNCPRCSGGGSVPPPVAAQPGCAIRTQINQAYQWCSENPGSASGCNNLILPGANLRLGALDYNHTPLPCLYGDSGCSAGISLTLTGPGASYTTNSGSYVAPIPGDYTLTPAIASGTCSGQTAVVHVSTVSCSNTSPGTNQLTGCVYAGPNFDALAGDAPSGGSLTSPVPDNPTYAAVIEKTWNGVAPNTNVKDTNFSIRWRGNFTFKAGTYTFSVNSDDGSILKMDGITVPRMDNWLSCCTYWSGSVTFQNQATHLLELELNNRGGPSNVSLNWTYAPIPPPDLVVSNLTTTPSYPIGGSNVVFTATILNQGGVASAASITNFKIDVGNDGVATNDVIGQVSTPAIATGASTNVSYTWTGSSAGSHSIRVDADISDLVSESNETNNIYGPLIFQVFNPLSSVTCSPNPSTVIPNQSVTWNSSVGGGGVPPLTYLWSLDVSGSTASVLVPGGYPTGTKNGEVRVDDVIGQTLTSPTCTLNINYTPFIQTQGGDVHSNTNIDTPGGP